MRQTKTAPKVLTEAEAIEAMKEYTNAKNRIATILAKKNEKLAALEQQFADDLLNCEVKATEKVVELQNYATANKQLFAEGKTLDLRYGSIGYKTNPPSVAVEEGKKEEDVINNLKGNAVFAAYVTVKYSLNKAAIKKAMKEDPKEAAKLAKQHLTIVQPETFFVEAKAA